MGYLMTSFALLFLLATVLGFLLGHWWARRHFVDVTESFSSLTRRQRSDDDRWEQLNGGLGSLTTQFSNFAVPKPDFSGLEVAIAGVHKAVNAIEIPTTDLSGLQQSLAGIGQQVDNLPAPERVDFAPLAAAIGAVDKKVAAISIPAPADLAPLAASLSMVDDKISGIKMPAAVDLSPLTATLQQVDEKVSALRMPAPVDLAPLAKSVQAVDQKVAAIRIPEPADISGLTAALGSVDQKIDNIRIPQPADLSPLAAQITRVEGRIGQMPKPPEAVDLAPVQSALSSLRGDVRGISTDVDLSALERRLDALDKAVAKLPVVNTHPPADLSPIRSEIERLRGKIPAATDLSQVQSRLDRIEALLKKPKPAPAAPAPKPGPALFKTAVHGKKDDLKRISGVGPKLERLLNKHGVFYFWQVASWSRKDIVFIDNRLDVFKGRIERDEWVRQAKTLQRAPGAATPPAA
ncbi:MAG: hypothetical protein AAF004_04675 [Pseudomonadota bacterium]